MRSAEWTLPGFTHDTCSAIHPLACGSPFFRSLPLEQHGLKWIYPEAPLAHPLDGGDAVFLERSVSHTAEALGADGIRYARLITPFVRRWDDLAYEVLAPIHLPKNPLLLSRFGWTALQPATFFARRRFAGVRAQALFAGIAAHSVLPLHSPATAAFGLLLAILGHVNGWPVSEGGSQKIADALGSYFCSLGGQIVTSTRIDSLDALPPSKAILCDVTTREFLRITGKKLPPRYRRRLEQYRYGPGVFKIDWALNRPIPWRSTGCSRAATVHVGGTMEEIAVNEAQLAEGKIPEKPLVIMAQQSLFDLTRAPADMHTAWGYCHVPNGCTADMTDVIEKQIERFAPGFRDCVRARHTMTPVQMETYNANYVGGDITGGAYHLIQLLRRPVLSLHPYATPARGLYICSSSTPPGGAVHGMCGYHAARTVLADCF